VHVWAPGGGERKHRGEKKGGTTEANNVRIVCRTFFRKSRHWRSMRTLAVLGPKMKEPRLTPRMHQPQVLGLLLLHRHGLRLLGRVGVEVGAEAMAAGAAATAGRPPQATGPPHCEWGRRRR
jgi:hypothetical protein